MTYFEGEASLYYYEDEKPHFYFAKDSVIKELISRKLLRYQNGKRVVYNEKLYKLQLENYLSNCPNIRSDIADLDYKARDMISLFRKYNKCLGAPAIYDKEIKKPKTEFRITSGLAASRPVLGIYSLGEVGGYKHSLDPIIGLSFNVIFPRNRGKWSFYNELIYTAHYSEEINTSSNLGGSYLKLTSMIRYQFPDLNIRPYINAGMSNAFGLYTNNEINELLVELQVGTTQKSRKYLRGFTAGFGTYFDSVTAEIRYEWSKAPQSHKLAHSLHATYLVIGYKF